MFFDVYTVFRDRVAVRSQPVRRLLRQYAAKGLAEEQYNKLLEGLNQEPLREMIVPLIRGRKDPVPGWRRLMKVLASDSAICSSLPSTSSPAVLASITDAVIATKPAEMQRVIIIELSHIVGLYEIS